MLTLMCTLQRSPCVPETFRPTPLLEATRQERHRVDATDHVSESDLPRIVDSTSGEPSELHLAAWDRGIGEEIQIR